MSILKTRIETHRRYHIPGCHYSILCPRNLVRFNTHNSKEHEMKKAEVCFEMQKAGQEFITEAARNGDVIDVICLDSGDEWEIINTHGLEKAVNNGRHVVKV